MCRSSADGGQRCAAHAARAAASALIPRRGALRGYYAATDAKHFPGGTGTGSQFTGPGLRRLNDVVELAWRERGSLDGDDRDVLAFLGTDPDALRPGVRYLVVHAQGTTGSVRSDALPDDTPVAVVRTKPGAPCSLVVETDRQPETGLATVVIGPHPDDPSREVVFTAHPGLPCPVSPHDPFGHWEGQDVPLGKVREAAGGDVWLNTRPRQPPPPLPDGTGHEVVEEGDPDLGLADLERLSADGGFVTYSVNHQQRRVTFAGDVWVDPDRRRQGVATGLLAALRARHPGYDVDPGEFTDDGRAWWTAAGRVR